MTSSGDETESEGVRLSPERRNGLKWLAGLLLLIGVIVVSIQLWTGDRERPTFTELPSSPGVPLPGGTVMNHLIGESTGIEARAGDTVVTLETPTDGLAVKSGSSLLMGATLLEGAVVSVEFLVDGSPLGEATAAPYLVEWRSPPDGSHSVSIRVKNAQGVVAESPPVEVVIGGEAACSGVEVDPDVDLHGIIADAGPGATLCFAPGEYRLAAPLQPRNGQSLVAAGGVVLSGALRLADWESMSAGRWVSQDAPLPVSSEAPGAGCEATHPRCGYNEDVFIDDVRLHHVESEDDVEAGTFFFDHQNNRIVIGDDPHGRSVEVAVASAAISSQASEVTIRGFTVEKFANPHQTGAIDGGRGWVIEANEVRHNHAVGIRSNPDSVVVGNYAHGNGQFGLAGNGSRSLIHANTLESNGDILWCCGRVGGSKWVLADSMVIRGNVARSHVRNGLWTDINNVDVLYEYNLLVDNGLIGLHHEISYDALIRFNRFESNGYLAHLAGDGRADRFGGDLVITASPSVEVYGNEFIGSAAAVVLNYTNRLADHPSDLGPHVIRDVSVHHNRIFMSEGFTGAVFGSLWRRPKLEEVSFDGNLYGLTDPYERVFRWGHRRHDFRSWQDSGNDLLGSLHSWDGDAGSASSGSQTDPAP